MKISKTEIAQRIKNIRQSKGLTLEEFGKLFNASKGVVSNWESARNIPSNARLRQIADTGNISVEELLYGDDRKYINALIIEIAKKYYNINISSDSELLNMLYNRIRFPDSNPFNTTADELYKLQKDFFDTWLLYPIEWDEEGMISFTVEQLSKIKKDITKNFFKDDNIFSEEDQAKDTYNNISKLLDSTIIKIKEIEIDENNTFETRLKKEIENNANKEIFEPKPYKNKENS